MITAIAFACLFVGILIAVAVATLNKPGRIAGVAWIVAHVLIGVGLIGLACVTAYMMWRYAP